MSTITTHTSGWISTITLNRPEAKNAFNEKMISELRDAFSTVSESIRAVILTGEGSVFCAGADINWMRDSISRSEADNRRDAANMESMFRAIDECPAPVIGCINGPAFGGGMGLVACCDIVVAATNAQFAFTEVRLGIVPAVISPYTLAKIGTAPARRYFLTGELFGVQQACQMGIVHEAVAPQELSNTVSQLAEELANNGPLAVRTTKRLIREVSRMDRDAAREFTVDTIARVRTSPEGQDGLSAFLEKREPRWRSG